MGGYKCEQCNYSTDTKFSYERHLQTKKHNNKCHEVNTDSKLNPKYSKNSQKNDYKKEKNDDMSCDYCNKKFANQSNLIRHKKKCRNKQELINKLLKEKQDQENQFLKEMVKKLEEDKKQLNSIIEHYQKTINNAGLIIKTSVSALSYIARNYQNAPVLEKLNDYTYITYKDDEDKADLIEMLYTHYETKSLHKYLGDIIVKAYKKDDPNDQSVWTSDPSRLTYIIREIVNQKAEWLVDKKGIKTTKYIIKPLMDYLDRYLSENYNEIIQYIEKNVQYMSTSELEKLSKNQNNYIHIIQQIRNNLLQPEILKYIAPYFHVTKLDQITNNDNDDNQE